MKVTCIAWSRGDIWFMNIRKMKKKYFFLLTLCCYFISCKPSIDDKRKATMIEIVNAILKNDTTKVFELVDTSFCYDIFGKEGFLFKISSLNTILSKEQIHIRRKDFSIVKLNDWDEIYIITFPLRKSDYDNATIEFSFYTGAFSSAYCLDASFKKNKIQPLDAVPSGN